MSLRSWPWWLAGIVVYLIFLLTTLPAGYAVAWLQKRMPDVRLEQISGSVWSGSAQDFMLDGTSWGRLQWHFNWSTPFRAQWGYWLHLINGSDVALQGNVATASGDKLWVRDLHGQLGIARLDPWLPLPSGSVTGLLDLEFTQIVLVRGRPTVADGVVSANRVSLTWPQSVILGSYQLKLQTSANSGIRGELLDTGGPLVLQGTLSLATNGRYQVSGTLASRDTGNVALNTLLNYLPTNSAGVHPFGFNGQWKYSQ